MIRNPYAKAPPRNPNAVASPAPKRPSHTAAASPAAKPNPYAKAPPRSPNVSNTLAASPATKPNPYAKVPPRSPNASNTLAASPAAKRARPCSEIVENGNELSATTTLFGSTRPLQVPARPPTRVGGTDSISRRLAQPTSHVVPGQRRLFEQNNFAHHGSSRPSACGGGSSSNNTNPGMDFDGGIDWDAAVLQLDTTTVTHSSSSRTTSATMQSVVSVANNEHSSTKTTTGSGCSIDLTAPPPPRPNNYNKTRSPTTKTTTTGSGRSIDLTASPPHHPNNYNKTRSPTISLATAGLVEARPPLHSKEGAVSSPSLASVQPPAMLERPTAWTTGAAMSGSPASATSNTATSITVDPRQATLPQVLQFDPDKVKPVNDQNRALLVQHANLSAPLLNGWTLFSHQKKAILRGLLMRRMILALDMGLGYVKNQCSAAVEYEAKRNDPCLFR
jgi:hypothetical protein